MTASTGGGAPPSDLAGVVLAAGAGTRLRPLTDLLPKALCPVANRPLVDWALERVLGRVGAVAVNAHHHLDAMLQHLEGWRVHVSVEHDEALGTAGALGRLRGWLDGRDAVVVNADAWAMDDLSRLVAGWDRSCLRLLVAYDPLRPDFDGPWRFAGASLMPWADLRRLTDEPSGLYEVAWREALRSGRVELVPTLAAYVDCGTPVDYLGANLLASGGRTVVGPGADVRGQALHSVVLAGSVVDEDERLEYAIRLPDGRTLLPFA